MYGSSWPSCNAMVGLCARHYILMLACLPCCDVLVWIIEYLVMPDLLQEQMCCWNVNSQVLNKTRKHSEQDTQLILDSVSQLTQRHPGWSILHHLKLRCASCSEFSLPCSSLTQLYVFEPLSHQLSTCANNRSASWSPYILDEVIFHPVQSDNQLLILSLIHFTKTQCRTRYSV